MIGQLSTPLNHFGKYSARRTIIRIRGAGDSQSDRDRIVAITSNAQHINQSVVFFEMRDFSTLEFITEHVPSYHSGIRFLVSDENLAEIHRRRSEFGKKPTLLVLDRCQGSLGRAIQFLASLNLPIEVSASVLMDQDEKSLVALGERLLFSPFIKTPVQPFFDILRLTLNTGNGPHPTLWDMTNERVGQNYFITDKGQISLSQRWAEAKRFFGVVDDTLKDIQSSKFFNELLTFKEHLINHKSPCATCSAFHFCEGFLCAFHPKFDCRHFIAFLNFMNLHAEPLRKGFSSLSNEDKGDVMTSIGLRMKSQRKKGK